MEEQSKQLKNVKLTYKHPKINFILIVVPITKSIHNWILFLNNLLPFLVSIWCVFCKCFGIKLINNEYAENLFFISNGIFSCIFPIYKSFSNCVRFNHKKLIFEIWYFLCEWGTKFSFRVLFVRVSNVMEAR